VENVNKTSIFPSKTSIFSIRIFSNRWNHAFFTISQDFKSTSPSLIFTLPLSSIKKILRDRFIRKRKTKEIITASKRSRADVLYTYTWHLSRLICIKSSFAKANLRKRIHWILILLYSVLWIYLLRVVWTGEKKVKMRCKKKSTTRMIHSLTSSLVSLHAFFLNSFHNLFFLS